MEKSDAALFNVVLVGTALKKRKAEKQLLYETVFICFWKSIAVILNILYSGGGMSSFYMALFLLMIDICTFLSNVCALILLLFISSVARRGFLQAFDTKKNRTHVTVSKAFTNVKKSVIPK